MIDTPTYEPEPQRDYAPRHNPIADAPATPADCARDYATAGDVRDTLDKQQRT